MQKKRFTLVTSQKEVSPLAGYSEAESVDKNSGVEHLTKWQLAQLKNVFGIGTWCCVCDMVVF